MHGRAIQALLGPIEELGDVVVLVPVPGGRQIAVVLGLECLLLLGVLEQVLAHDIRQRVLFARQAVQLARALGVFAVGGETRRVDVLQVDVLLGVVGDLDDVAARHAFADPLAIQDGEIRTTLGGKLGKDLVVPLRGANQVALD